MLILTLIVATLAVARLSRLVAEDVITVGFRQWVVRRFGVDSMATKLVHCAPWCLSMWFALIMPFAVFFYGSVLLAILAVPAASMVSAMILNAMDRES